MNPDNALANLREAIKEWNTGDEAGGWQLTERLAESAEALDVWLSQGGYLPADWSARA